MGWLVGKPWKSSTDLLVKLDKDVEHTANTNAAFLPIEWYMHGATLGVWFNVCKFWIDRLTTLYKKWHYMESYCLYHSAMKEWHYRHCDVIRWKHFPRYCTFEQETTDHQWIPLTKVWYDFFCQSEQTVEQKLKWPVIPDAMTAILFFHNDDVRVKAPATVCLGQYQEIIKPLLERNSLAKANQLSRKYTVNYLWYNSAKITLSIKLFSNCCPPHFMNISIKYIDKKISYPNTITPSKQGKICIIC